MLKEMLIVQNLAKISAGHPPNDNNDLDVGKMNEDSTYLFVADSPWLPFHYLALSKS
jgi:hypothetical protein